MSEMPAKKSIEVGQTVKGYAVLISRDGGRSQRFSFGWADDVVIPYQEHVGPLIIGRNLYGTMIYYPQIALNLDDEKDTLKYIQNRHRYYHMFHASGSVVKVHHRPKEYHRDDLVDVDHFMITEEVE